MSILAPTPPRIGLTQCLVFAAGLSWAGALVLALIDANASDLPDPMITGVFAVAITLTLTAVYVGLSYSAQRRLIGAIDDGIKLVADDTGSIPVITDTMESMPTLAEFVTLVDEMGARLDVINERQRWLLVDRGLLPDVQPEDDTNVRHLTKEAYRLGRRTRPAEES